MWEKDESGSEDENETAKPQKGKSQKGTKRNDDTFVRPDRYLMDTFLVRREASLLLLAMKAFRKRVIVFFNEKR